MFNKKASIFFYLIFLFIAFFMDGNASLRLHTHADWNISSNKREYNSSFCDGVHIKGSEIREIKIKIRYMGSECSYSTTSLLEIRLRPETRERIKFLKYADPFNIYFLDSFHLRGPPNIA